MNKSKTTALAVLVAGVVILGQDPLAAQRPAKKEAPKADPAPKVQTSFGGTLIGIDADKHAITIGTSNRATGKVEKAYELAKDVAVLRDGKAAKVSDLKNGVSISVKLSADAKSVVSVSENGKSVSAPLKAIDVAKNSITLTVTTGGRGTPEKKDVTHQLAKEGKVTLEGKEVRLADLKDVRPGSTVRLIFSVDDATKLLHIDYSPGRRQ